LVLARCDAGRSWPEVRTSLSVTLTGRGIDDEKELGDLAPDRGTPTPLKRSKSTLAHCEATTSSGGRCKAKPHKNGLCFFHSDPKKAAELGRKGGRANRHTYETLQEVAAPESAGDVKRMLAEAMADIRAGRMDPKLGSTIGYLGTALLRAFELADFEQRLKRLEQRNDLEKQAE
jgi:hypothetical protein